MPIFFAQAISSRQVRTMELYFTKEDVPSAAECATLCGQRHFFCQSAIYNHDVRSCALSPNRPIQCSLPIKSLFQSKQRFNYFHLKTDGADALSLLACIQICQPTTSTTNSITENVSNKEETRTTIKQSLEFSPIHDEEKSASMNKKKLFFPGDEHAIDVLQRLFQMRQRLEQLLGEANRNGGGSDQASQNSTKQPQNNQKIAKDSKPTKTNFSASKINKNNGKEILIQSGGFVARLKPDEQIRVISTPLGIKQNKNKQQKQIAELNKNNATTFDERRREESEYWKGGEDDEPIIINGKLIEPPTGYLHSVLIHHSGGISSEADEDKTMKNDENKILPSLDVARLSKSNGGTIVCFRFIQHRHLQDYGKDEIRIGMKRGLSLNECRCECADTWKHEEETQCKSIHFGREEGLCELLSSDHSGKSDLVFNKSSDYHYISCERKCLLKYLLKTAEKMCGNKSNEHETFNVVEINNINTTLPTEKTIFIKSELKTNKSEFDLNKSSDIQQTNNLIKPELSTKKPEFNLNTTETKDNLIKSEFDLNKNTIVQQTPSTQTFISTTINSVIDVDNNQKCFERISGYSMNGTAASLEHNVSVEECKCLCANSLHSRYPFQCASVSYFGVERDCVLNLHNRQSAPEQFTHEPEQQVIYLGFLCHSKEATAYVENVCSNNSETSTSEKNNSPEYSNLTTVASTNQTDNSTIKNHVNPPASSTQDKEHLPTPLSDACFMEQPGYVLEGMALAARQQVSPELCKCICAVAEWKQQLEEGNVSKTVGGCRSSQFYKNSGTCLISGENRASAPERFSFDENSRDGVRQSSYLDFRCGADKKALLAYIQTSCPKELPKGKTSITNSTNPIETPKEKEDEHKTSKKKKKNRKTKKFDDKKSSKNKEENKLSQSSTSLITSTLRSLSEEKEDEQLEVKTAIPSEYQGIESTTTELEEIGENWKTINVEGEEKRKNKVYEGGDEKEEEEKEEKEEKGKRLHVTAAQADPPKEEELQNRNENSTSISSTISIDNPTDTSTTSIITETLATTTINSSIINETLTNITTDINSTLNYTEGTTETFSSLVNGNLFEYPSVGQCRFSALYQTVFNGARLLKRLLVDTPAQCLAACHYESCRSANLIQMEDKIVEFRRNDVLSFDRLAVHFDSIQCKPRTE
uniref:Apple domain-containing protein n=1 Tax=Meloidogyne hapla TaxID=6305 RepID=A0A1I8BQG6_MELHA